MRNRLMRSLQRPTRPVAEHVADKAHEVVDRAAAQAGIAEARVRHAADASAEKLAATQEQAKAALAKTRSAVRRHPLAAAAGCAALAGAAFVALRRKRQ
jgi:predicted urease superfamily metal-dependent hydrolase